MAEFALRHCYASRQTGSYTGGNHIVLAAGRLDLGRLHREQGDALCKPRRKFNCLMPGSGEADCKRCLEVAARAGVDPSRLSHATRDAQPSSAPVERRWLTAAAIANELGVTPAEVERLLVYTGLRDSKANGRGEGAAREYSPGVVLLIQREHRARGGR